MIELQVIKEKVSDIQESITNHRDEFIGGSDAGTILGFNPYKSAYTLWAEKTNKVVNDFQGNEATRIGHDLEEYVAKRFEEATGKKVHRSNYRYKLKSYPFIVGHVDRLVVGEKAGLECKTAGIYSKTDYEGGDIPPSYYAQCQHYMAVTGCDHWYIAILVLQKGFYWSRIDRDEEEIKALLEAEIDFWNHVQSGEPVSIDGSESTNETLNAMHTGTAEDIDLSAYEASIYAYSKNQQEIKTLQEANRSIQNELKAVMGTSSYGHAGNAKIAWKNVPARRLDSKALKSEHPDLYESYSSTSVTQRFTVTVENE